MQLIHLKDVNFYEKIIITIKLYYLIRIKKVKPGRKELEFFLDDLGIDVKTYDHGTIVSKEEEEVPKKNPIIGVQTKNLFLKDRKGHYFLIAVEDNAHIDLKTIHNKIGASGRVSFGSNKKLKELLGLTPEDVCIFSALNDMENQVKIVIDKPLIENDFINDYPMSNEATMTIVNKDLLRFVQATGHDPLIVRVSK